MFPTPRAHLPTVKYEVPIGASGGIGGRGGGGLAGGGFDGKGGEGGNCGGSKGGVVGCAGSDANVNRASSSVGEILIDALQSRENERGGGVGHSQGGPQGASSGAPCW